MNSVRWYRVKLDAQRQASKMRKTGWPGAHVEKRDDGLRDIDSAWCISTHLTGCDCGCCPFLMTDGTVQGLHRLHY